MKVREIITASGWRNGSGWSYTETLSDQIIDIDASVLASADWSWFEPMDLEDGTDVRLTMYYYAADDEDCENVLAEHKVWVSDLIEEK